MAGGISGTLEEGNDQAEDRRLKVFQPPARPEVNYFRYFRCERFSVFLRGFFLKAFNLQSIDLRGSLIRIDFHIDFVFEVTRAEIGIGYAEGLFRFGPEISLYMDKRIERLTLKYF